MSKLFDYLKVTKTNERKVIYEPLQMVTGEHSYHTDPGTYSRVCRVRAVLGADLVVPEELLSSANFNYEAEMRIQVYRPLAEEVFGEYRKPLIDAQFAMRNNDVQKASKLIDDILDSMFKV